jgi:hypothetical protein
MDIFRDHRGRSEKKDYLTAAVGACYNIINCNLKRFVIINSISNISNILRFYNNKIN